MATLNFWHPRFNNPRICGSNISIFLGLHDSTFDIPLENWHPQVYATTMMEGARFPEGVPIFLGKIAWGFQIYWSEKYPMTQG